MMIKRNVKEEDEEHKGPNAVLGCGCVLMLVLAILSFLMAILWLAGQVD